MKEYEKVFLKYQNDADIIDILREEKYLRLLWEVYLAGKQEARNEILNGLSKSSRF